MNNAVWNAAWFAGYAVILVVAVAFPGWPVIASMVLVIGGFLWLYRVNMKAIDEFYERADRDAG